MAYEDTVRDFVEESLRNDPKIKSYFSDKSGKLKLGFCALPRLTEMPCMTWLKVSENEQTGALNLRSGIFSVEVQINLFSRDNLGEGRTDKISLSEISETAIDVFTKRIPNGTVLFSAATESGSDADLLDGEMVFRRIVSVNFQYEKIKNKGEL